MEKTKHLKNEPFINQCENRALDFGFGSDEFKYDSVRTNFPNDFYGHVRCKHTFFLHRYWCKNAPIFKSKIKFCIDPYRNYSILTMFRQD